MTQPPPAELPPEAGRPATLGDVERGAGGSVRAGRREECGRKDVASVLQQEG